MPNVEIHGLSVEDAKTVRERIFVRFRSFPDQSVYEEMVVTICQTDVTDKDGNPQPFLRLLNTNQNGTPLIIDELQKVGLDIEHLHLAEFYPKEN